MININNQYLCCGCSACVQVCPKGCISMHEDREGFLYPIVDDSLCIDCGQCERVCPFLSDLTERTPYSTYAAINPENDERLESSSGGIFYMLAKAIIEEGGVVYGAAFDCDWNVRHIAVERIEDICKLQGSKYVQSIIGTCFRDIRKALMCKKKVLFSGTACQVAGLKNFLHKDYDTLLTIDVVCHGVPSPRVWRDYVSFLKTKGNIESIHFRDKKSGWVNYNFTVLYSNGKVERESHNKNLFMQGFLHDLYLRPSCHKCMVKGGRCASDITLGDFWGVEKHFPLLNDDKGVSLVLANTMKGERYVVKAAPILYKSSYEKVILNNRCLLASPSINDFRNVFWDHYNTANGGIKCINRILSLKKTPFFKRVFMIVKSLFYN